MLNYVMVSHNICNYVCNKVDAFGVPFYHVIVLCDSKQKKKYIWKP